MFKLELVFRGDYKIKDLFIVLLYFYFLIVSFIRFLWEVCVFVSFFDFFGFVKLFCYWIFVWLISILYISLMMIIFLFIYICYDRLGLSRVKCGLGIIVGVVLIVNMIIMLC